MPTILPVDGGAHLKGQRLLELLPTNDPVATAAVLAIHCGELEVLGHLLSENPAPATDRLGDRCGRLRTLPHVVTDRPGHYPNGADTVRAPVAVGSDVNARFAGPHTEAPLHWAAGSDDVEVLDALLVDAGANLEDPGSVIDGGGPLTDAVAFGQWKAARRLIDRGARANLRQAAGLGLMSRIQGVRCKVRASE